MPFPIITRAYHPKKGRVHLKDWRVADEEGWLTEKASRIGIERVERLCRNMEDSKRAHGGKGEGQGSERHEDGLRWLRKNVSLGSYARIKGRVDRIVKAAAVETIKEEIAVYWLSASPSREAERVGRFVEHCIPYDERVRSTLYLNSRTGEIWDFMESEDSLEKIILLYRAIEQLGKNPHLQFTEIFRINLGKWKSRAEVKSISGRLGRPADRLLDETIDECYWILHQVGVSETVRRSSRNLAPYRIMLPHFSRYFSGAYPIRRMRFPIYIRKEHCPSLEKLRHRHRHFWKDRESQP